jgi:hypothetical protein
LRKWEIEELKECWNAEVNQRCGCNGGVQGMQKSKHERKWTKMEKKSVHEDSNEKRDEAEHHHAKGQKGMKHFHHSVN